MGPLGNGYRGGGYDLPRNVTLRLPWVFADSGPRKYSPILLSLCGNIHQLCTVDPCLMSLREGRAWNPGSEGGGLSLDPWA